MHCNQEVNLSIKQSLNKQFIHESAHSLHQSINSSIDRKHNNKQTRNTNKAHNIGLLEAACASGCGAKPATVMSVHIRLFRFVCSDSLVQICFLIFVASYLFLHVCLFVSTRFFRFLSAGLFVQICFFRFVSSDSFLQIRFFNVVSSVSFLHIVTLRWFSYFIVAIDCEAIKAFVFCVSSASSASFIQLRFFRFISSASFLQLRVFRFGLHVHLLSFVSSVSSTSWSRPLKQCQNADHHLTHQRHRRHRRHRRRRRQQRLQRVCSWLDGQAHSVCHGTWMNLICSSRSMNTSSRPSSSWRVSASAVRCSEPILVWRRPPSRCLQPSKTFASRWRHLKWAL